VDLPPMAGLRKVSTTGSYSACAYFDGRYTKSLLSLYSYFI
jgi:hypothetical protein